MAYNNIISRNKVQALIPEDVAKGVITKTTQQSAALTMFRRVPVAQTQQRIPILSALPTAYWLTGDTGLKQTSEMAWANKYLNIEELACIVPIPENVLDDTSYDVWGEVRPLVEEAIGRAFDAAVFFGVNAPGSFPVDIMASAAAAGNTVTEGSTQALGGFHNDVDLALAVVEADGYDVSGFVAARNAKAKFRQARATTGSRLLSGDDASDAIDPTLTSYLGEPIAYPMRGLFPSGGGAGTNLRLFAGQWDQFVVGVRKDITYKILDQAVIQDNTGAIQYNLAQQDMVAMRVTFRAGWQVANIINYDNPNDATRYPVASLLY
jgi:HK97 family phage major capsid protein